MRNLILPLLALVLALSGCDALKSTGRVNGSVFVVTSGAGSYKLALVKVYFCKESDIHDALNTIGAEFPLQDDTNFNAAKKAEADYESAAQAASQLLQRQKRNTAELSDCEKRIAEVAHMMDKAAVMLEGRELQRGNLGARLFVPSGNAKEKLDAVSNYFDVHPPAEDEVEIIKDEKDLFEKMRVVVLKAKGEFDDISKVGPPVVKAADETKQIFADTRKGFDEFPRSEADQCLKACSISKYVAETDADGAFSIELPKRIPLVILAKATRTVGTSQESYWWIVPFKLESPEAAIKLDNDNELFEKSGGGAALVNLLSKSADYHWKNLRYDADGNLISQ